MRRRVNKSDTLRYTAFMAAQKKPEMGIVSLAPSATSILCAIGARRLLVGVTKWCCDVAAVAGLPQVGDCWRMESVADVVALRPTLVIGSVPYKTETVGKLLEQRLNFLAMNPRTIEDVYADIRLLGGIAGRAAQAETLIRKMRPGQAYKVEAWTNVPAIRERRVFAVRDELLNTPGPPLMEGARELSRLMHQDRRKGI